MGLDSRTFWPFTCSAVVRSFGSSEINLPYGVWRQSLISNLTKGTRMKLFNRKKVRLAFLCSACLCLLSLVAAGNAATNSQKTKFTGTIISRESQLVKIQNKKGGSVRVVAITDSTKIERQNGKGGFWGSHKMNRAALVPGLSVQVQGMTNADGTVEAREVKFRPDAFTVTVAQQNQIEDNRAAVGKAQTTADQGVAKAAAAQTSADKAQSTADQGLSTAQSATAAAAQNEVAVKAVNRRVSDLGDYATVAELGVYFRDGNSVLSAEDKASLDQLVAANSNVNGYVIQIAGYTSSTGSKQYNQRLSERRAAAVAQYLRENANVSPWRIVVPAGYGATHPVASNSDAKGQAMNRRVEVKVLVSKGLQVDSRTTGSSLQ